MWMPGGRVTSRLRGQQEERPQARARMAFSRNSKEIMVTWGACGIGCQVRGRGRDICVEYVDQHKDLSLSSAREVIVGFRSKECYEPIYIFKGSCWSGHWELTIEGQGWKPGDQQVVMATIQWEIVVTKTKIPEVKGKRWLDSGHIFKVEVTDLVNALGMWGKNQESLLFCLLVFIQSPLKNGIDIYWNEES